MQTKCFVLIFFSSICIIVNCHLFYKTLDWTLVPAIFIGFYILDYVYKESSYFPYNTDDSLYTDDKNEK